MSPGPIRFGHQATVSSADGPGSRLHGDLGVLLGATITPPGWWNVKIARGSERVNKYCAKLCQRQRLGCYCTLQSHAIEISNMDQMSALFSVLRLQDKMLES